MSTITAATADLFARLEAAAEPAGSLEGVQVTFGPPAAHEEQEVIALMGIRDAGEEYAALGAQRREETYDIELGVKVHDPTSDADNAAAAFARSRELVDAIEAIVHGSSEGRTLGGSVRTAHARTSRTDGIQPAEGGGWVVFWRVYVTCAARLTV